MELSTMANEPPRLWGVSDVVLYLGMKKSWVYARADSGELPCIRLPGGRLKFDPKDIFAWKERLKKQPARVLPFRAEE